MTGENIPKKCFAGVTVNEGPDFKLEVQEVNVPDPGRHLYQMVKSDGLSADGKMKGPGELLLKLNCTGLCGSDIHYMTGDLGLRPSSFGVVSAGHEVTQTLARYCVQHTEWK